MATKQRVTVRPTKAARVKKRGVKSKKPGEKAISTAQPPEPFVEPERERKYGRKKGVPSRYQYDKETALAEALGEEFDILTEEELSTLTSKEALRICMIAAFRAREFGLMVTVAEKLAPYEHAKLTRVIDYAGTGVTPAYDEDGFPVGEVNGTMQSREGSLVRNGWLIKGGLPDPLADKEPRDAEEVVDEVIAEAQTKKRG